MTNWYNYFLSAKNSRLTQGHLKAEDLYNQIMNHDGSTAYCCYFDLDYNLMKLEWDTGKTDSDGKKIYEYTFENQAPSDPSYQCNGKTFTQYEGICRPALGLISFDFDSENPEDSLEDVKKFVAWLGVEDSLVFFSGSKGFHVMVPEEYFPFSHNEHLPNQLKDLAKRLKEDYPTLDTSIYNYNRKFRVPFSKHEKGLYKIFLDFKRDDIDMEYCYDVARDSSLQLHKFDFRAWTSTAEERKPLAKIVELYEEVRRKSYEVEKHRAGTREKPSPFERFENKLCIKKMLESTCDDVGRNNAALRIVNDYYRTGKPRQVCEEAMMKWASNNGLPVSELNTIINNIYHGKQNYNFGCQDDLKSAYCSAKCDIWSKLDPDKRPVTVDSPPDKANTPISTEFKGVTWLMGNIFGCEWDEEKRVFNEGLIVKQNAKDLFYYKDNYWQYLDESKIQVLKTKLNAAHNNKIGVRKLDAIFKMFIMYVPEKPDEVDLFCPRTDMANFNDGTLHLTRDFKLEFRDHNRLDFCINKIELNYKEAIENINRRNDRFEDWLFEYSGGDEEAFNLISQMFGASLMPKFPQIFFLLGKSGTGKSTTIKIMKKLHQNEKNISGVSPDKFHGFHMSSMVGKTINIVNDIKTTARIDDDIVKQIDDQELVRIEVKGRDDIYAPLPALHIYGANRLPATMEGYSGAMVRRVSIINFDKQYQGKINHNIASDLFDYDALGVLCFALRGLESLVIKNNGAYSKGKKSIENVTQWTKEEDVVKTFLDEMSEEGMDLDGKTCIVGFGEGTIKRADLWRMFNLWQEEALDKNRQFGKMRFFNMMKHSGFVARKSDGIYVFRGLFFVDGEDDSI